MRKARHIMFAYPVALIAAFVTVFAISTPRQVGAAESIKIGLPPFYSNGLYHIAANRGFWKEEGLDVALIEFNGAPQVNEALLGGSVQFGHGGVGPAVALISRTDRVISFISEAYADKIAPPELMIVREDSPYQDIKQLAGKKVGVHAKGTLSHILLEQVKQRLGIDMIVLEIPAPSQYVALRRGDVDAVMNETPFPEQMKAQGGRYLYGVPNDDVVPALAITQTLTTREFAERNPEVVVKVARAVIKAARWAMEHPKDTRALISQRRGYDEKVVELIDPRSFKWSRNGAHLMPSIKWWGQSMQDLKLIQKQPKYEDFFVSTYVDIALKQLGKVPDPDFDSAMSELSKR